MIQPTNNELLLVEDNPADADLFQALLQDAGMNHQTVRHVQNINDALKELKHHAVGLVLLDLRLPDGVGVDNVKSVRNVTDDIPIIVLTGIDDEELAISCIDAGAQDYLCKGEVQPTGLRRAIGYAVTRLHEARARENQIRLLVSCSPDAVVVTGREGRIQFVNDAAVALFGKSAAELMNQPFGYPITQGNVAEIEVHRGVETRTADMRAVAFEWDGRPAYLASLRDTTENKLLQKQLIQSQKMEAIGQLASGVAHDFNNILAIINGYAEIMLETSPPVEQTREMVAAILDSGQRATALTQKLLAFGRKSIFKPTTLDLNPVISDMQKMLERIIGPNIELTTLLEPDLHRIKADPSQLDQIMMNLVVNARDAMPEGGRVTIETSNVELAWPPDGEAADFKPGRYVLLKVSDTGMGMSDDVRSHIFEPFFTTKDIGKGTGLGLATVYGIVSQSGGHIAVTSEPGRGTAFLIYLPCADEAAESST